MSVLERVSGLSGTEHSCFVCRYVQWRDTLLLIKHVLLLLTPAFLTATAGVNEHGDWARLLLIGLQCCTLEAWAYKVGILVICAWQRDFPSNVRIVVSSLSCDFSTRLSSWPCVYCLSCVAVPLQVLSHSGSVGCTGSVPQGCPLAHSQPHSCCLCIRYRQHYQFGSSCVPTSSFCCVGLRITLVCRSQGGDYGKVHLFSVADAWIEAARPRPVLKRNACCKPEDERAINCVLMSVKVQLLEGVVECVAGVFLSMSS